MSRGEECYSHVIRPESFSEPVPLDCELHKCFSVVFFSSPLGWDRMARAGWSWTVPFSQVS